MAREIHRGGVKWAIVRRFRSSGLEDVQADAKVIQEMVVGRLGVTDGEGVLKIDEGVGADLQHVVVAPIDAGDDRAQLDSRSEAHLEARSTGAHGILELFAVRVAARVDARHRLA